MKKILTVALMMIPFWSSCQENKEEKTENSTKEAVTYYSFKKKDIKEDGLYAVIKTDIGDILLNMEFEKTPVTVGSFVALAEGTLDYNGVKVEKPYFNGINFHRVVPNFVIQGGDPTGTGAGGPGYKFPDEIHPELKHDSAGVLSMANAGKGTNGSQFFITLNATPHLNGKHAVFGSVLKGMDVVNAVKQGTVMNEVLIVRKGKAAKNYDANTAFVEGIAAIEAEEERKRIEAEKIAQERATLFKSEMPKAKSTASGLKYVVLQDGNGNVAAQGENVKVHYQGMLLDGSEFDNSYKRNQPIQVPCGQGRVIPGWDEALSTFKKGTKLRLYIPPNLGYGARGAGGVIPPNATLVFEMEILND